MAEQVVLCVLEGWGENADVPERARPAAAMPNFERLKRDNRHTQLAAHGEAVGLPAGAVGCGAHGYRTLGAGRAVPSQRLAIDERVAANTLGRPEAMDQLVRICLYDSCSVHLVGLLTTTGVHADIDHLHALVDLMAFHEIPIFVHAIVDANDGGRRAIELLNRLELHLEGKNGKIATISGRHYAMDRDGNWDRVHRAYQAIVRDKELGGASPTAETPYDALRSAQLRDVTDAELLPVRIGDYAGMEGTYMRDFSNPDAAWTWTGEATGVAFNYRGDRLAQLTGMFMRRGIPDELLADMLMDRQYPELAFREHCFVTLTDYGPDLDVPIAFPSEPVTATLSATLAEQGVRQLLVCESGRAALAPYFRGRHEVFAGEEVHLIQSNRLADRNAEAPEMRCDKVVDAAIAAIAAADHGLVLVSLANADAVAHDGDAEATAAALECVDVALGRLATACAEAGATLLVTSTHGQAERVRDDEREPHVGHTAAPVPFIVVGDEAELRSGGTLADVAPTVLELLGRQPPSAMTGRSLRKP